jgi:D-alanyl-D-alanine carboxypeptidase (penicillin-binding protein 5/6)
VAYILRFFQYTLVLALFALGQSAFLPEQVQASNTPLKAKRNAQISSDKASKRQEPSVFQSNKGASDKAVAQSAKRRANGTAALSTQGTSSRKYSAPSSSATKASEKKTGRKRDGISRKKSPGARAPYKSAIIVNVGTGKILFAHNPNSRIPPASLTKILAMFVAEDAIRARNINSNTLVTVSRKAAAAGGSRMGLGANDKVPLVDLLHGMAVSSGNDASIAVAEYIGGSEKQFVQMMNRKAASLGMSKSTFVNANGLPAPGQYSTAKDMLILARAYLAAYPDNLQKHHNHSFNSYNGNITTNANPLLKTFQGADGLKTGFVNASGYNLIATAQRNGQRVIGVILGAPSRSVRAAEANALLEACFSSPETLAARSSSENAAADEKKTMASAEKKRNLSPRSAKNTVLASAMQDKAKKAVVKKQPGSSSKKGKKTVANSARKQQRAL